MTCSNLRGSMGPIKLYAPDNLELKPLTDEELKYTIPCYCDRCGTQLRIHPLFPQVGGKSLEHACVAKNPNRHLYRVELIEVKPYDMPVTKILDPEWRRQQWEELKKELREEDFLDKAKALLERAKP